MRLRRHARLPAAALLICGLTLALLPLACTPTETRAPVPGPTAAVEKPLDGSSFVVRHLAGKVDLLCPKATVRTALAEITRQRPDIHLFIDTPVARDDGLDTVIGDFDLRQIPVEEALRLALAPHRELVFLIEPERVLVTTRDKAQADLVTAVHPIDDIQGRLTAEPGLKTRETEEDEHAKPEDAWLYALSNLIKFRVSCEADPCVAPWNDKSLADTGTLSALDDGGAEMSLKDGLLWIRQTREGQALVAAMLTHLRVALAASGASVHTALEEVVRYEPAEPEETIAVRQLLGTRIDVDFKATPLPDALVAVGAKTPGLQYLIGPEIAASVSDFSTRLITLRGRQVTVRSVLGRILPRGVAYDCRPAYLWVAPYGRLVRRSSGRYYDLTPLLEPKTYDLTGLLEPVAVARDLPDGRGMREVALFGNLGEADLLDIIKQDVSATSNPLVAQWSDEGGRADIQVQGNALFVSQTRAGHEKIAALLRRLLEEQKATIQDYIEQTSGKLPQFRPPVFRDLQAGATAEEKAALAHLEQVVNFQFADKPLAEVIEIIQDTAPSLNLVVDDDVAAEGVDLNALLVTLNASNMSVRTILRQALGTYLGWWVRDGWVEITTRAKLRQNLPEATYLVQDIVVVPPEDDATPFDLGRIGSDPTKAPPPAAARRAEDGNKMACEELVELIKKTANATSDKDVAEWSDEGGPAVIQCLNGMLIISQTPRGHEKVCECLNDLARQAAAPGGRKPLPPKTEKKE